MFTTDHDKRVKLFTPPLSSQSPPYETNVKICKYIKLCGEMFNNICFAKQSS